MAPPKSILKHSPDGVRPIDGGPAPVPPLALPAPRRCSNSVRFPPSPTLTRTFSVYSAQAYDRSPIVVLPNTCALPARGCPGRTYHPGSPSGCSGKQKRIPSASPNPSKHLHPSRVAPFREELPIPSLIFDLSSESDESDGVSSPPPPPLPFPQSALHAPQELSMSRLSLSFLPHAGGPALFRAPESDDSHQYYTYDDEKQRRRRDRDHKGHRTDGRHGARSRERTSPAGVCTVAEELEDEEDAEEDDLSGCSSGRYKTFGERSTLSTCGFDDGDDGCLGGF